jgi:hypothetical protein
MFGKLVKKLASKHGYPGKGNDAIKAAQREREERVLDTIRVENSEGSGYCPIAPSVPWRNALDRLEAAGRIRYSKGRGRRHGYWVRTALKAPCLCRLPKRHRDCAYCGYYGGDGWHICGTCRANGVDGPVIRGTERRVCRLHKEGK